MKPTEEQLDAFIQAVREASNKTSFAHNQWFVKYHLEIVDRIADELLEKYPDANPEIVKVLVWLHDYGKTFDFSNQYELTLVKGREKLSELGYEKSFIDKVIDYMVMIDKKLEIDLRQAPIEVQIVSSADGCSHLVGPSMAAWWHENPDKTVEELMEDNRKKANKDWNHKIVLPEARQAFERYYEQTLEQAGDFPEIFIG